jgi:hypothetical protein
LTTFGTLNNSQQNKQTCYYLAFLEKKRKTKIFNLGRLPSPPLARPSQTRACFGAHLRPCSSLSLPACLPLPDPASRASPLALVLSSTPSPRSVTAPRWPSMANSPATSSQRDGAAPTALPGPREHNYIKKRTQQGSEGA